jgi:hypothetical protein
MRFTDLYDRKTFHLLALMAGRYTRKSSQLKFSDCHTPTISQLNGNRLYGGHCT